MVTSVDDNDLDRKIEATRTALEQMRQCRKTQRQDFVDIQGDQIMERQFLALQGYRRLMNKSSLRLYKQAIYSLSDFDDLQYVMNKEAQLLQVLHAIEVKTNETRRMAEEYEKFVFFLEDMKAHETNSHKNTESRLLQDIKYAAIDLSGLIVEHQRLAQKLEGGSEKVGLMDDDTSITLDSSSSSSWSSMGSFLSEQGPTKKNKATGYRRTPMAKRITNGSSYFGIRRTTAKAA